MTTSPSETTYTPDPVVGISVSMKVSMLVRLTDMARQNGMSRSEFIRHVIEQAALIPALEVHQDDTLPDVPKPGDAGAPPDPRGAEGAWPEGA